MHKFDKYKNIGGTYTSPKNDKTYKNLRAFAAHMSFNGKNNLAPLIYQKVKCKFCGDIKLKNGFHRHEQACYLNPTNLRLCKVCKKAIKKYKTSKGTCSRGCANTYFRSNDNHWNWNKDSYRTTCFLYHKKECVVCKEKRIVEVHHLDGDNQNNLPENLVPLCPTHHRYWHSRYKIEIQSKVINYIQEWKLNSNRM